MQQAMERVITGLIRQLEDQGSHPETISNYRIVCNSIIRFCRQRCTGNEILFSPELLDQYLEYTEQCDRDGGISKGYFCFKKRIIRMLGSTLRWVKQILLWLLTGKHISRRTDIWPWPIRY